MTPNDPDEEVLADFHRSRIARDPAGDFAVPPPPPVTPPAVRNEVVVASPADPWLWRQAQRVPAVQAALQAKTEVYPATDAVAYDAYKFLFNREPELTPLEHIDPAFLPHALLFQVASGLVDVAETRLLTVGDDLSSAIGVATLLPALIDLLLQEQNQGQEPGQGQAGQEPGQEQTDHGPAGPGHPRPDFRSPEQRMRVGLRQALSQVNQAIQEVADAEATFADQSLGGYGTEPGHEHASGDVRERAARASLLLNNAFLRRLVHIAGRVKVIAATAQKARVEGTRTEIFDVEYGRDLSRLLNSAWALLAVPETEVLFFQKFARRALPQYKFRGRAPAGRGPIILTIDESGSMSGDPLAWAKAVFLAIRLIAREQHRDLRVVCYGSAHELEVFDFPQGAGSTKHVLACCQHDFAGGTAYEGWMTAALEAIESSAFQRADVIAISDGECAISADMLARWTEARHRKEFKSLGILLGRSYGGGRVLSQICAPVTILNPGEVGPGSQRERETLFTTFTL